MSASEAEKLSAPGGELHQELLGRARALNPAFRERARRAEQMQRLPGCALGNAQACLEDFEAAARKRASGFRSTRPPRYGAWHRVSRSTCWRCASAISRVISSGARTTSSRP